jgi:AcrR family transcriptional regulator
METHEMSRQNAKEDIARAALATFAKVGVDAATTRVIAREAGVSEGAIYRHFPSKDALASELFMGVHRRLVGVIQTAAMNVPATSKGGLIGAQIDAIVDAYCKQADDDWLLFSFHLVSLHHFLASWREEEANPVSVVREVFEAAIERGELPPQDPELLAGMALGVVTQTAQNLAYGRLEGPLSRYAPAFKTAIRAIVTVPQTNGKVQ